jgi:2-oxoisovalerate dehydrogenase E2 component (dihydrolipoyl transacylase)
MAARLLSEHGLGVGDLPAQRARVTKVDVLRYLARQPSTTPSAGATLPGELIPLTSMRRAIAEHMAQARRTIPHGQTVMAADVTSLVAWREDHKAHVQQHEGANLTFTVLFVYALARALGGAADLGMAVALDGGLIVPVVRNAAALTLGETARAVSDLAARARAGRLGLEETQGAQMTVTNVGSFGNLTASPIVPLGQRGILGPGLVERRPLRGPDGGIRLGWRCLIALVFDRRVFDELQADRLLRRVLDELDRIPTGAHLT